MPMSKRPLVSASSIAASSATRRGFRYGRILTMVPSRMRLVLRAAAAINRLGEGIGPLGDK